MLFLMLLLSIAVVIVFIDSLKESNCNATKLFKTFLDFQDNYKMNLPILLVRL